MDKDTALRTLAELNVGYIRSVQASDVAWFDEHLDEGFLCTGADGVLLDRAAFLARTAQPPGISGLQAHDVQIRLHGDAAVIHAATAYRRADGSAGAGRYTDVWVLRGGRWRAVAAHVGRS